MKTYLLTLLYFAAGPLVNAEDNNSNSNKNEDMNTYKKDRHALVRGVYQERSSAPRANPARRMG
jgi:hypothetical protein